MTKPDTPIRLRDEQIKLLEGKRDQLASVLRLSEGSTPFSPEREQRDRAEYAALTALLTYVAETREMLEAADHVGGWLDRKKGITWSVRLGPYDNGKEVWTADIDGKQITQWHDSAVEAFAAVKREKEKL